MTAFSKKILSLLLLLKTCSNLNQGPILFATAIESIDPRIVGGEDADPGEYSFFVSWGGSCGATVIHDDILLTAAHCYALSTTSVTVGAYTRGMYGEPDPINSELRTIQEKITHPQYDAASWQFDMMLIKLTTPVPDWIPRMTLNDDDKVPVDGSDVTVIGMGKLDENGKGVPTVLQEVTVQVVTYEKCNSSPMYPDLIFDESMICAAVDGGGQDACFGDSGGPLMQDVNGVLTQVGIVSFGIGCARGDKPGVYSRVSAAYDWIQKSICDLSDNPPARCLPVTEKDSQLRSSTPSASSTPTSVTSTSAPVLTPSAAPVSGAANTISDDSSSAPTTAPTPQTTSNLRKSIYGSSRSRIQATNDYVP